MGLYAVTLVRSERSRTQLGHGLGDTNIYQQAGTLLIGRLSAGSKSASGSSTIPAKTSVFDKEGTVLSAISTFPNSGSAYSGRCLEQPTFTNRAGNGTPHERREPVGSILAP